MARVKEWMNGSTTHWVRGDRMEDIPGYNPSTSAWNPKGS